MDKKDNLRNLPSVNELVEEFKKTENSFSNKLLVEAARQTLNKFRSQIIKAETEGFTPAEIRQEMQSILSEVSLSSLRRVINATGVVLHTNLGRAVLGEKARNAVNDILKGYCNLELNLSDGKRGSRYSHVEELLRRVTGAEAAVVVNNNAAAVFLVLSAFGRGKNVVVSRGQLVEIGGAFRVPEILAASGAKLLEVGTTNKTKLSDYEKAINEETAMLLRVHTSNYRIVGFTEEVPLEQMVALARKYDIPLVDDLGSGFLINLKEWGITDEPTVQESVSSGADIVTFSGDKLLGGPQAGIIVGRKEFVEKIKKHPLNRALRVDKMTIAALEAILREYLYEENILEVNPTLEMLTISEQELKKRALKMAELLNGSIGEYTAVEVSADFSEAGGGSLPTTKLPTWVVRLAPKHISVDLLAEKLRNAEPAILVRIADGKIILDLRTIRTGDFEDIKNQFYNAVCKR